GSGVPRDQSARCQLEVAQLAMPLFLTQCEAVLREYVRAEGQSRCAHERGGMASDLEPSLVARSLQ
ncbi:hypothetical protein HaLaN_32593, partial [Haematococcus lacustris]